MAVTGFFRIFCNCVLVASVVVIGYGAEEREPCKTSQISGFCTTVPECEIAMLALSNGRPHHLKRCGFTEDDDEILCCPSSSIIKPMSVTVTRPESTSQSTDPRLNTKRKCERVCEEISTDSLSKVVNHIIGGTNTDQDEFPHMAAIGYPSDDADGIDWSCGASIIFKNFLLTAAHCFTKQIKPIKVRVGVTRLDEPNPQDFNIKNVIVHSEYDPSSKHNDIALVEVEGEITFNEKTYPACLYSGDVEPKELIITGWGKTTTDQEDDRSIHLQKATVVSFDLKKCNDTYVTRSFGSKTIDRTQLCAETAPGKNQTDACWGDSGGPCQIKKKNELFSIVSIISYGQQCGSRIPGVYTRVSAYLDWIEKYAWPNL